MKKNTWKIKMIRGLSAIAACLCLTAQLPGTAGFKEVFAEGEKISLADTDKILVTFKQTKSKVNDNPRDGGYYYKGSNMKP